MPTLVERPASDAPAARREVVAPEGSRLAEQLRAAGWVVRAGWRASGGAGGASGWMVRLAPPPDLAAAD